MLHTGNFVKISHLQIKWWLSSFITITVNIYLKKNILVLLICKIYQSVSIWLTP
jgi:hypothetical protein